MQASLCGNSFILAIHARSPEVNYISIILNSNEISRLVDKTFQTFVRAKTQFKQFPLTPNQLGQASFMNHLVKQCLKDFKGFEAKKTKNPQYSETYLVSVTHLHVDEWQLPVKYQGCSQHSSLRVVTKPHKRQRWKQSWEQQNGD